MFDWKINIKKKRHTQTKCPQIQLTVLAISLFDKHFYDEALQLNKKVLKEIQNKIKPAGPFS